MRRLSKQQKKTIFLFISTVVGVLGGILSSIINTRALDPVLYGDVRYVQNIYSFLSTITLFGYFYAGSRLLALSNDKLRSENIRGALICILGSSCVLIIIGGVLFSLIRGSEKSDSSLLLISLPICFYPIFYQYINTVSQGDNHIGRIAVARISIYLCYVPLAYFIYRYYGATPKLMMLLQWGIYTFITGIIVFSAKIRFNNLKIIFKELKKENKDYGRHQYIGSIVMVGSNYIAGISLGILNPNNTEVGFYTLALTLCHPLTLLPAIIGTSYYKQFAYQKKIPNKVFYSTLLLTFISCIIFIFFIRYVVLFLYSIEYITVATYAALLAIGLSMHGFGDMLNRYLGSHGQGKSIKKTSITCGILRIIGFTILIYFWGINGAIITVILCGIIYCLLMYRYYYKFTKLNN